MLSVQSTSAQLPRSAVVLRSSAHVVGVRSAVPLLPVLFGADTLTLPLLLPCLLVPADLLPQPPLQMLLLCCAALCLTL